MPTIDKIKLLRSVGFFPTTDGQEWRNEENSFGMTAAFVECSPIELLKDVLKDNGFVIEEEGEQSDKAELLEYAGFSYSSERNEWLRMGHVLTPLFVANSTVGDLRELMRTNGYPVKDTLQSVAKIELLKCSGFCIADFGREWRWRMGGRGIEITSAFVETATMDELKEALRNNGIPIKEKESNEKIDLLLNAGFYRDYQDGEWKVQRAGTWHSIPIALAEAMTVYRIKETLKDMGFLIIKKEEKEKEETRTCNFCEQNYSIDSNLIKGIESVWVCNDCQTTHTFICYGCGDRFLRNNRLRRGGVDFCRECGCHYHTCESCDGLVHEDNLYGDDSSLCESCYEGGGRHEGEGEHVESWYDLSNRKVTKQKKGIRALLKKSLHQKKIRRGHSPGWHRKDSGVREVAEKLGNLPIPVYVFGLKEDREEDFMVILPRYKVLPERNGFKAAIVKFLPWNPSFEEHRFEKEFGIGINLKLRTGDQKKINETVKRTKQLIRKLTKKIH